MCGEEDTFSQSKQSHGEMIDNNGRNVDISTRIVGGNKTREGEIISIVSDIAKIHNKKIKSEHTLT